MMNRNVAIAVAVIAVIALAGIVIVVPALLPKTDMTVTFYDADGNVVWTEKTAPGLFDFAFTNEEGSAVTKAVVTVNYVVSGNTAGSDIEIGCEFHIEARVRDGGFTFVGDATKTPASQSTATGQFEAEFILAGFIEITQAGELEGWRIVITAMLSAAELDESGDTVRVATPWAGNLGFDIDWYDDGIPFTVVGSDFVFGPS